MLVWYMVPWKRVCPTKRAYICIAVKEQHPNKWLFRWKNGISAIIPTEDHIFLPTRNRMSKGILKGNFEFKEVSAKEGWRFHSGKQMLWLKPFLFSLFLPVCTRGFYSDSFHWLFPVCLVLCFLISSRISNCRWTYCGYTRYHGPSYLQVI